MATAYITGDTYRFRAQLKGAGYTWEPADKAWSMEYDGEITPQQAIRDVRLISGIRNRGEFAAEVR